MHSAVVILYYNKTGITSACAESVMNAGIPSEDIFLFSNGSGFKNYCYIREKFKTLSHLHSDSNSGYSGGFNRALKWVFSKGYSAVLFLTNDTIVTDNSLQKCLETSSETGAELIVPTICYERDRNRIDSSGGFFDRERFTLSHYHTAEEPELLGIDDYIPGTAFFITKNVFEVLDGMDESYGTYWDDADFSFRACHKGIKIARAKESVIYHRVGKTCHKKPLYTTYYFQRNRIIFCKKYLSPEEYKKAAKTISEELDKLLSRAELNGDMERKKYLKDINIILKN